MSDPTLNPTEKFVYDASRQLLNELGMETDGIALDVEGVDWNAVQEFLRANRLFPTLYPTIEQHLPASHREQYANAFEVHVRTVDLIIGELVRVLPVIHRRDPGACVSKCFMAADMMYGSIYRRTFGDVDLLTTEADIEPLGTLLIGEGYISERNPGSIEVPYHQSFWEVEYGKALSAETMIHIEMKWKHTSFDDSRMRFFRESVQWVEYKGKRILTSDLTGSLLLTIGAAYKNSDFFGKYALADSAKLREYVDLGALLLRHGHKFDPHTFADALESLNYGYRTAVVMRDLCSLYPFFRENALVSEVLKRKWNAPPYSLYWPNHQWRSSILTRIMRRDQGRAEFVALLKNRWFDANREPVRWSADIPLKQRVDLVKMIGEIRFQLEFVGRERAALEVEVPEWLVNQYPCKFVLYMTFEDAPLTLPPPAIIEIDFRNEVPVRSSARWSRTFRKETSMDSLLQGRTGKVRACISPVLSRFPANGGKKDLTEDHWWTLPTLVEIVCPSTPRAATPRKRKLALAVSETAAD